LFREIDEDLRHEKYAKLWKKYGIYVIGAAILLVAAVAGHQAWRSYELSKRDSESQRLVAAMALANADPEAAEGAFRSLAEDASGGYQLLARFQEAAAAAKLGKRREAAALLDKIASQSNDPMIRDVAILLSVMQILAESTSTADTDALESKLTPLTTDDNPWRFSARELTGILAYQSGDTARAHELFNGLATAPDAPPGLRTRAIQMAEVTKSQ
jgi:hypothetical protein